MPAGLAFILADAPDLDEAVESGGGLIQTDSAHDWGILHAVMDNAGRAVRESFDVFGHQ